MADVDLDPAHLRSFLAIVRYGGYHRAAEALHLTQPAVSRHMRRLEEQLGEPLFARRGRGVELTPYGERAARGARARCSPPTTARWRACGARRRRRPVRPRHDREPRRPGAAGAASPSSREQLGERALQLRVDRSASSSSALGRGEVDAAIVVDPGDAPDALELGTVDAALVGQRRALAGADPLPEPFPLVAYDPPCSLRDARLRRLDELGLEHVLAAESPHLSGVQSAVRNGLGYALLAAGGDGLRAVARGPLAETIPAPLWLLLAPAHRRLAAPLRAALWRATMRRGLPEAA